MTEISLPESFNKVIGDIHTERRKQLFKGYDKEHDAQDSDFSMACVGALYAANAARLLNQQIIDELWPLDWDARHWKPKDARTDLIRAATLIIAEIEKLDRKNEE